MFKPVINIKIEFEPMVPFTQPDKKESTFDPFEINRQWLKSFGFPC